jgi:carbon-monoxide dehydrogenase medium subunit
MKPVAFEYERPRELSAAIEMLARARGDAKVMAGAQSLGPMMNLRLAQPRLVVDVGGIPELRSVEESTDSVFLGSCVTHAAIEDGKVPDPARGLMREVAANIA